MSTHALGEERVRRWAEQRIERCRVEERKFADAWPESKGKGPPQALVEAWTERRTLQQLLDLLDEDETPIVCPGCHTVAPERCVPGCIDDEMAREREEGALYGDHDRGLDDEYGSDEDECECPVEGHGLGCPRDRLMTAHRVGTGEP